MKGVSEIMKSFRRRQIIAKNPSDRPHFYREKQILKEVPKARQADTVRKVITMLEKKEHIYDAADYIYVIDRRGDLVGVLSMRQLFNSPKSMRLKSIMSTRIVSVPKSAEPEQIAHLALKHDLKSIPVVEFKKLVGVVSSKMILSVVNRALREDIFHFAGIHKSHLEFESSMDVPIIRSVKNRLSWLTTGILGALIMTLYITLFEKSLTEHIVIAAFIPALVYISGAVGIQIQTLFVRDLAMLGKSMKLKKYLRRQTGISLMIAAAIGVMLFLVISLIWQSPHIAFVISLATLASLVVTSVVSFSLPLTIRKFKADPAMGSGPIGAIISDASSVVIYFIMIALLL